MQMSFFFSVLLGPEKLPFFSQSKTKQKKLTFLAALVNSIFTAVLQKGEIVSVLESLTLRGFKTLNNPEETDDPNRGVPSCFLEADRHT